MNANIRKLKITINDFHSYFNDSFFMYKFLLNLLKYSFRNDKVKLPHNIEKIEIIFAGINLLEICFGQ